MWFNLIQLIIFSRDEAPGGQAFGPVQTVQSMVKNHVMAAITLNKSKKIVSPKTYQKGGKNRSETGETSTSSTPSTSTQLTQSRRQCQKSKTTSDRKLDVLHADIPEFDGKQRFKAVPLVTKDKVYQGNTWISRENAFSEISREIDRLELFNLDSKNRPNKNFPSLLPQNWDSFLGPFHNKYGIIYMRIPLHCDYKTALDRVAEDEKFISNELSQFKGCLVKSVLILNYFTTMKAALPLGDPLKGLEELLENTTNHLGILEDPLGSYQDLFGGPQLLSAIHPMVGSGLGTSPISSSTQVSAAVKDEKEFLDVTEPQALLSESGCSTVIQAPLSMQDIKVEPVPIILIIIIFINKGHKFDLQMSKITTLKSICICYPICKIDDSCMDGRGSFSMSFHVSFFIGQCNFEVILL